MIQALKRKLRVMRIDKNNLPYKIASDKAEIIKTFCITPVAENLAIRSTHRTKPSTL